MLHKDRYARISLWLIRFLELQLFLSLISLPLLIAWGLPFSLMSVVGNLVFSPLLMLFLTLSSLLFFSELLHIPNGWLAYCLEGVASIWQLILSVRQPGWLIGFVKLPIIVLCSIVLVALWIVSRRMWYARTRIIAFLSLFALLWSVSWVSSGTVPVITTCACNKGSVIIIHYHNKTVLIDPGYIGQRPSASSWVQYTLAPYVIQLTGSLTIDYMIVLQPSSRMFEALASLCTKLQVSQVYMPWWQGTLSRGAWHNFFVFKEMLARTGGTIKRFGDWPIKIPLPNQSCIRLLPLEQMITYHEARYTDTRVDCCIDKDIMTFYAAKHTDTVEKKGKQDHEESITNHSP
jgi:hypothetical protein